ncbi:sensor histidine kinase [Acinetobacter sp. MB5]|uniref:sensor histidine kinase n=1 Tax=Acinetobacter sp. MB5 TaxID=2069438 RepID=UPI000DD08BBA|nr:HAMP domain-containing sensor histidine kinase [Acinetobacter sp. MB5]
MLKMRSTHTNHRVSEIFNRHYWFQIALIALSIIIGIVCSAWVIKGSLLKTALEQEMAHYWQRVEHNPKADLPDTKNLYGYRWNNNRPLHLQNLTLKSGVHRIFIDGKERMTVYGERYGQHVLLVFGESNVNKLVWFYGLAPLMLSLFILYSFLWWSHRRAKRYFSPITRIAKALEQIDWENPQTKTMSPFQDIDPQGNTEAAYLKETLEKYHHVLSEFILREREFSRDVSHELRTPLTIFKGNLQLCIAKYGEDRALIRLQNTLSDMELLVDTLLAISRNHVAQLQTEPTFISQLIRQLIDDLESTSQAKGIQILFTGDIHEPQRALYISMSKMVFGNILRNALNYSQGTEIEVILQKNMVIIADNGIGIQLSDADSQQEFSIHPQLQQHAKGHGIGLQLVQKLCQQLGWRVELFDRQYYTQHHPDFGLNTRSGLIVLVYLGSN